MRIQRHEPIECGHNSDSDPKHLLDALVKAIDWNGIKPSDCEAISYVILYNPFIYVDYSYQFCTSCFDNKMRGIFRRRIIRI
jgi:hypothetical protein